MKRARKFVSALLCAAILASACPPSAAALAADEVPAATNEGAETSGKIEGSNIKWAFDTETGTLTFTLINEKEVGEIPDYLHTEQTPWNAWRESIKKVVVSNGIGSIGKLALGYCTNLKNINLPKSLTTIGESAFSNCINLESIKLPDSVISIGDMAFYNCDSLTSIELPDGISSTGVSTFQSCRKLEKVVLPENLTSIGWSAFSGCLSLTQIVFPANLQSIGAQAFTSSGGLDVITFTGQAAPTLGDRAFSIYSVDDELITIYVPLGWTGDTTENGYTVDNGWEADKVVEGSALSDMTVKANDREQTLTPKFWPGTMQYTLSVDNTVESVTLSPTARYENSSITVNGAEVTSGESKNISLREGTNTITVTVADKNNAVDTRTYTLTITKAAAATYTVSFDENGGSGTMADVTEVIGSYTLPACAFTEPEGKQFAGWAVGSPEGKQYAAGTNYTISANTTFYAIWEDVPTYTISAEPAALNFGSGESGSSAPAAQTVTITNTGNQAVRLTQPTAANYEVGALTQTELAANETATFTVQPKAGLPAGSYDEIITVNGTNGASSTVKVTFSVYDAPYIPPAPPTYKPTISESEGGTLSVTPKRPEKGDEVTITPAPEDGYEVDKVIVTDKNGNELDITENDDGTFTFTQPSGRVTITVTYKKIEVPTPSVSEIFIDVAPDAWYIDAVQFAYDEGIMTGTSDTTFSPELSTTRGMIVAILHRLEESPAASGDHFTDVADGDWYADAVNWAASEGIVNGMSATMFAPNAPITREQLAAILHNYAEYKGMDVSARADLSKYADAASISDWARDVISWAVGEELIAGITNDTLDPQGNASRAQVAAIFERFLEQTK